MDMMSSTSISSLNWEREQMTIFPVDSDATFGATAEPTQGPERQPAEEDIETETGN